VSNRQTLRQERRFKCERTPDQERDEVGPPLIDNLVCTAHKLAASKNAITRQVGSKISARGNSARLKTTRLGDLEQGAWLGVESAKRFEVRRHGLWKDHEVGLDETHGDAGGGAIERTLSAKFSDFGRSQVCKVRVHGNGFAREALRSTFRGTP
jgi:hypothetical protein